MELKQQKPSNPLSALRQKIVDTARSVGKTLSQTFGNMTWPKAAAQKLRQLIAAAKDALLRAWKKIPLPGKKSRTEGQLPQPERAKKGSFFAHFSMRLLPGGRSRWVLLMDGLVACAVIAACAVCLTQVLQGDGSHPFTVTDRGRTVTYQTKAASVNEALQRNGYTLQEGDTLSVYEGSAVEDTPSVEITRTFPVVVRSGDQVQTLHLQSGTVGDALRQAGVSWDTQDELSYPQFADVSPCMYISHQDVTVEYRTEYRVIEYQTKVIKDSTLDEDVRKRVSYGENGEKRLIYRTTYLDGVEANSEIVDQVILKKKVDDVVIVGTQEIRFQTNLQNDHRRWRPAPEDDEIEEILRCEVTAYTHTGNRTATGTWPKLGTIAVDPDVIPYGTKLYVPGYGYGTAQDCGAFSGNQIDLFMDTRSECLRWGRKRNVKVYILK